MNEDLLFNELRTSLGQAIDYAEGDSTKARKKTVAIKELATFSA